MVKEAQRDGADGAPADAHAGSASAAQRPERPPIPPQPPQDTSSPAARCPLQHGPSASKRPCARSATCPPGPSAKAAAKAEDAGEHVAKRSDPWPAACSPGRSPPAERELDGEVCGPTPYSCDDSLLGVSLLREFVRDSLEVGHTGHGVHTSATAPAERASSESAQSALVNLAIGGLKALLEERRAGKRAPDDAPPCFGPRDVVSPLRKRLRCQSPSHGPCEGEGWLCRAVYE